MKMFQHRRNRTSSSFLSLLAVAAAIAAIVFSGGCGSDNAQSSKEKIALTYEKALAYGDYSDFANKVTAKGTFGSHSAAETAYGAGSPYHAPFEAEGVLLAPQTAAESTDVVSGERTVLVTDSHVFAVSLKKNYVYSIVFSSPKNDGWDALSFVPDVHVYTTALMVTAVETEYRKTIEKPDAAEIFSFTAPGSGTYYISVGMNGLPQHRLDENLKETKEFEDSAYRFILIEDIDKTGLQYDYYSPDSTKDIHYDLDDLISFKYVFWGAKAQAPTGTAPDLAFAYEIMRGLLDDFKYGHLDLSGYTDEEGKSAAASLRSASVQSGASDTSGILPSILIPIPDDPAISTVYPLGNGVEAFTLKPMTETAVSSFEVTSDEKINMNSTVSVSLIQNFSDYDREFGVNAEAGYKGAGFSVKANAAYSGYTKFSSDTITMIIKVEYLESTPRKLDDSAYKLKDAAKKLLSTTEGAQNFRNVYGDYFVAGQQYGASYYGIINIRNTNKSQLEQVAAAISGTYSGFSVSTDVKNKLNEITKNSTLEFHAYQQGGDVITSKVSDINSLWANMETFQKSVKRSNLVAKNLYLLRYKRLDGAGAIPEKIPYSSARKKMVLDLMNKRSEMIREYTRFTSVPTSDMLTTYHESIDNNYKLLTDNFNSDLTDLWNDEALIKDYMEKFTTEMTLLRNLNLRYDFFSRLKQICRPQYDAKGDQRYLPAFTGFDVRGFGLSSSSCEDLIKKDMHEDTKVFDISWTEGIHQKEDGAGDTKSVICGYALRNTAESAPNNSLTATEYSYPTIGKNEYRAKYFVNFYRGLYLKRTITFLNLYDSNNNHLYPFMWDQIGK